MERCEGRRGQRGKGRRRAEGYMNRECEEVRFIDGFLEMERCQRGGKKKEKGLRKEVIELNEWRKKV